MGGAAPLPSEPLTKLYVRESYVQEGKRWQFLSR